MDIARVKFWQWLLIGAAVGALVGYGSTMPDISRDLVLRRPVSPLQFVSLVSRRADRQPAIRNLVVHPPRGGQNFVTGEMPLYGGYTPFAFYADVPFVAGDVRAASVVGVLKARSVAFEYPWRETAWFVISSRALAGVILIGALWPMVLNLLRGAPLLGVREPKIDYDLDRFAPETSPQIQSAGSQAPQLDGMLRHLEEHISEQQPLEVRADQPTDAPAPIRLSAAPLESLAPVATDQEPKEYRGEFYPVAKPHIAGPGAPAFSLVELIVVVGIVTILISLLLPAIQRARAQAAVTACASNLRQINIALQMYINDNRQLVFWRGENLDTDGMDWYAYGGRETGNADHDQGDYFNKVIPRPLNRYVSNKLEVFHCPKDDAAPWTNDPDYTIWSAPSQFDWVGNSYNFNANGYPLRPLPRRDGGLDGIRFSSITNTSQTVVFFDACLFYGFDWHYAHKGNVAFADGHVDFLPLPAQNEQYKWNP